MSNYCSYFCYVSGMDQCHGKPTVTNGANICMMLKAGRKGVNVYTGSRRVPFEFPLDSELSLVQYYSNIIALSYK